MCSDKVSLRLGDSYCDTMRCKRRLIFVAVNGILLHHNIEKQMSDSRGDVAYLMADISDVKEAEIRDLFQSLEELPCKLPVVSSMARY